MFPWQRKHISSREHFSSIWHLFSHGGKGLSFVWYVKCGDVHTALTEQMKMNCCHTCLPEAVSMTAKNCSIVRKFCFGSFYRDAILSPNVFAQSKRVPHISSSLSAKFLKSLTVQNGLGQICIYLLFGAYVIYEHKTFQERIDRMAHRFGLAILTLMEIVSMSIFITWKYRNFSSFGIIPSENII